MPSKNVLLRVAVTVVLVGFLFWRVDLGQLWRELRHANYIWVPPAIGAFLFGKFLVAERWRIMMKPFGEVPVTHLFGTLLVSNLANLVLPARIGTVVRMMVPARRHDIGRPEQAGVVFGSEPLLEGLAFAGIGLFGLALVDVQGFPSFAFWLMVVGVAIAIALAIPFSRLQLGDNWTDHPLIRRLPGKAREFLNDQVPRFVEGFGVFRNWKIALPAVALSFVIWMFEVLMFLLLGQAFHVSLGIAAWMLVMVAANVVTSLPLTPSNLGAYEVVVTELLIALGVSSGVAGGYAIVAHLLNMVTIAVAGLVSMWVLDLGFKDLFSLQQDRDQQQRGEHQRVGAHAAGQS